MLPMEAPCGNRGMHAMMMMMMMMMMIMATKSHIQNGSNGLTTLS